VHLGEKIVSKSIGATARFFYFWGLKSCSNTLFRSVFSLGANTKFLRPFFEAF
jgi:hypothetical protein